MDVGRAAGSAPQEEEGESRGFHTGLSGVSVVSFCQILLLPPMLGALFSVLPHTSWTLYKVRTPGTPLLYSPVSNPLTL